MKTPDFKILRGAWLAAMLGLLLVGTKHVRGTDAAQTATSEEHNSTQWVYIGGEVKIPQRCQYTNGMTLSTAIKIAKGVTENASLTKVRLTRAGKKPVMLDRRRIEEGKNKDIKLEPGDVIFVPPRSSI